MYGTTEVGPYNVENYMTPLLLASKYGHAKIAELILSNNNPWVDTWVWTTGNTPLMLATQMGHCEVIEVLLRKKADTEIRGDNDCTALMWACRNFNPDVVKVLLRYHAENRADIEAGDEDEFTLLMNACVDGNLPLVELLLQLGANAEAVDDVREITPLLLAIENGHLEIVKLLSHKNVQVEYDHRLWHTPMWYVSRRGDIEIVQALMESGAQYSAFSLFEYV